LATTNAGQSTMCSSAIAVTDSTAEIVAVIAAPPLLDCRIVVR